MNTNGNNGNGETCPIKSLTTAFTFSPPPKIHSPIYSFVDSSLNWFNQTEEEKIHAVLRFQKRRTPLLDNFARIATFCSDEEFYILVFLILFWGPYCDIKLGTNLVACMGFSLGLGNMLKNIFCLRRPPSPPVWNFRSSDSEELEFSFPSSHAILSVSVSMTTVVHFWSTYETLRNPFFFNFCIFFVLFWATSISLSRVYLGAHSFQDVAGGLIFGAIFGPFFATITQMFNHVLASIWIGGLTLALSILLIYFHPISRTTPLNFHFSEGTLDYSVTAFAALAGSQFFRFHEPWLHENCNTWNFPNLFLRLFLNSVIAIMFFYGSNFLFPRILEPMFKFLKLKSNYLPVKDFRSYIISSIELHDKKNSEEMEILKISEISRVTENQKITEIPKTENQKIISENTKNPDLYLHLVRIFTKFLKYFFLGIGVTFIAPLLSFSLGI